MKNKRYADVKRRVENARNHCSKTEGLLETKKKVIEHDN